ncbi:MAG: carbohydrate kinase family protein [Planctomycetes bacterium]|nr:carbohydrate kinase family protein [Planctomycetota bacterium]
MLDVLCFGIIVSDHLCSPISRVPRAGELVLSPRFELAIGGNAANVSTDLAKLGVKVGVVGLVGQDVFGRHVRESLEAAGVDCRLLCESPTSQTSQTLIVNVQGEDRRFIHAVGANADFDASQVTPDMVRDCRVLFLGGYLLAEKPPAENIVPLFRAARQAGIPTLLDVVVPGPGDYWARLRPVLALTDVFMPNEDESVLLTGETDPWRQAEAFRSAGVRTAIITRGGQGCVIVCDDGRFEAPAHRVPFVDGTGSGDAFVSGYILGLLRGNDTLDCVRLGSAMGASCVRSTGATTGVFNAEELAEFLAAYPLTIARR